MTAQNSTTTTSTRPLSGVQITVSGADSTFGRRLVRALRQRGARVAVAETGQSSKERPMGPWESMARTR